MDTIMVDYEAYLRFLAAADYLTAPNDVELLTAVSQALAVEDGKLPSAEQVATAARAEGPLLKAVEGMAGMIADLTWGAAAFAARPGEEALAQALQKKAASVEALRAGAAATAAAARCMQEDSLRRMAADEEDAVDPELVRQFDEAARQLALIMDGGTVPSLEQAAAAAVGEVAAELEVGRMAELADWIRKGAAAFPSGPGKVALLNKAAAAEKHGAAAQHMGATLRRYRLSRPLQL